VGDGACRTAADGRDVSHSRRLGMTTRTSASWSAGARSPFARWGSPSRPSTDRETASLTLMDYPAQPAWPRSGHSSGTVDTSERPLAPSEPLWYRVLP